MNQLNIVAQSETSTVLAEYETLKKKSQSYQSEAALEKEFIRMLCEQGYEYLTIKTEDDLINNLRVKLQELNAYEFTDAEWTQFFNTCIAGQNDGIVEKTRRIQEDHVQTLQRENGMTKNIMLIDKKNIHNNRLLHP